MNKVLVGEVNHPTCNLSRELQQEVREVGVLEGTGKGLKRAVYCGMYLFHVVLQQCSLTPPRGGSS